MAENGGQDEVRTRRLVITDDAGKERVELTAEMITMKDAGGGGRVLIGINEEGGAFVQLHDGKGTPRAVVLVHEDGAFSAIELGNDEPDYVQLAVDLREAAGDRSYVVVGVPEDEDGGDVISSLPAHVEFNMDDDDEGE
jgi:hypothetical protein